MNKKERRDRVEAVMEQVGLIDRLNHKPKELSGGQEQRVAIARALVTDPSLIVADEPTGDLDRQSADEILDLLASLSEVQKRTIVMVTHDPKAAARASRLLELEKGKLLLSK
jgi:putative ABC transport system ATP-binding protein